MASQSERLYPIQSHANYGFYTGVTPSGREVLMGLFCPYLLAFHFDAEGNLLGVDDRPVPFFQGVTPPYNIYDERIAPLLAWAGKPPSGPSRAGLRRESRKSSWPLALVGVFLLSSPAFRHQRAILFLRDLVCQVHPGTAPASAQAVRIVIIKDGRFVRPGTGSAAASPSPA